jgi:glycerophosphoryl diester phosphodiesterase
LSRSLDWLTTRPIAHRGLHDGERGIIENTAPAVQAAIDCDYGVEVDVQISADGEAMVHHDDVLGRLNEGSARLDSLSAQELKRIPFRRSAEHMLTLGELCGLVGGKVTMLVELKSRFDSDARLCARVADVLASYHGPVAAMSFDPRQMAVLRHLAPALARGIVAAKYRPRPYWNAMPAYMRYGMGTLLPAVMATPQFVAYAVADLPALAPLTARHVFGLPLLTWAVRTDTERQCAARWADQMIFEGFRP